MLLVSIRSIALTFLFVNYHLYTSLVAFLYFSHQFFFYVIHFHLNVIFQKIGSLYPNCMHSGTTVVSNLTSHAFFLWGLMLQCLISLRIIHAVNWDERQSYEKDFPFSFRYGSSNSKFNIITLEERFFLFLVWLSGMTKGSGLGKCLLICSSHFMESLSQTPSPGP